MEFLFLSKMAQVPMRMAPGGGHGHPHHLPPSHHAIPGHLPSLILYTIHFHLRFWINFSLPPTFWFNVYTSRRQCCGSLTFWYHWLTDPGSDPNPVPDAALFVTRQWPSRCRQKYFLFSKFFCLLVVSHKTAEIKGFPSLFALWWKDPDPDSDPFKIMTDPDPGIQNIRVLMDPDPQNC